MSCFSDTKCDIIKVQKGRKYDKYRFHSNERQVHIMNAEMKFTREEIKEMGVVSENCNCSVYSMITVAGGILLAVGTVIYSLISM